MKAPLTSYSPVHFLNEHTVVACHVPSGTQVASFYPDMKNTITEKQQHLEMMLCKSSVPAGSVHCS